MAQASVTTSDREWGQGATKKLIAARALDATGEGGDGREWESARTLERKTPRVDAAAGRVPKRDRLLDARVNSRHDARIPKTPALCCKPPGQA